MEVLRILDHKFIRKDVIPRFVKLDETELDYSEITTRAHLIELLTDAKYRGYIITCGCFDPSQSCRCKRTKFGCVCWKANYKLMIKEAEKDKRMII